MPSAQSDSRAPLFWALIGGFVGQIAIPDSWRLSNPDAVLEAHHIADITLRRAIGDP